MSSCIIVANMLPPHFGWGTRAPGLRAEQLATQARPHFDEVRFLLFLERYGLMRTERGFAILTPQRADTTVIHQGDFKTFAERIEPATFVFTQADFTPLARQAATRHAVVYDILAPRWLELGEAGADERTLERYRNQHRAMLQLARRTLVNGPKTERLLVSDLAGVDWVPSHLAPTPLEVPAAERTHLLFGGKAQRWTDVTLSFNAMAAFAQRQPSVGIFMVSERVDERAPHAAAFGTLAMLPNVATLWNLSSRNYHELMARSFGFVDWAPLNEERIYATSTRVLQAIAAGVPVLHQAGTGLDEFFDAFPGERIGGTIQPEDVARFVEKARAGAYREAVAAARDRLAAYRSDTAPFAGLGLAPCA